LLLHANDQPKYSWLDTLPISLDETVRAILQDSARGMDWLVAAVVHDSIGYYSPLGAENLVNDYLRGERENCSERCSTCFHSDLEKEMMHDISAFEALSADKQRKVIATIKEVRKNG
jgi:hypothetical protein